MRFTVRGRCFGLLLLLMQLLPAQGFPYFDGAAAFALLDSQVALGPRYPGSPGHVNMEKFLERKLEPLAHKLTIQRVRTLHPYRADSLEIVNYIARFNPSSNRRILLLAHYDTRAVADQDPDPENRATPILGANDGASGVAILLQLARIMALEPPQIGVDLLFTDAEDIGRSGTEDFSLGTKAFVPQMSALLGGVRPRYAVLLDMVGDAELTLPVEYFSWTSARSLVERIWGLAEELGVTQFRMQMGPAIYDDHIPLQKAGIPAVDIIDFDYPNKDENFWHTLADTPDKCSPESLEAVGTVITALVYLEKP